MIFTFHLLLVESAFELAPRICSVSCLLGGGGVGDLRVSAAAAAVIIQTATNAGVIQARRRQMWMIYACNQPTGSHAIIIVVRARVRAAERMCDLCATS